MWTTFFYQVGHKSIYQFDELFIHSTIFQMECHHLFECPVEHLEQLLIGAKSTEVSGEDNALFFGSKVGVLFPP